jgi:hypothetical protein
MGRLFIAIVLAILTIGRANAQGMGAGDNYFSGCTNPAAAASTGGNQRLSAPTTLWQGGWVYGSFTQTSLVGPDTGDGQCRWWEYLGSGNGAMTFSNSAVLNFVEVYFNGTAYTLTLTPSGGVTINGSSSVIVLQPGQGIWLMGTRTATNWDGFVSSPKSANLINLYLSRGYGAMGGSLP